MIVMIIITCFVTLYAALGIVLILQACDLWWDE